MLDMSKQEISSIIITFLMGLVAGAYLFIYGFSTTFKLPEVTTDDAYTQFVVTGEGYGACDVLDQCLSFQVLENGKYRAILENGDNEPLIKEGSIPRKVNQQLKKNLTAGILNQQSQPLPTSNCRYGPEANNYRYQVSVDLVNYTLDTCQNQIDYNGQAWLSLVGLWNYFTTVKF